MARMTSEGMSLADAMEHYPGIFPKGAIGSVRAGESGGYLPDACMTVSEQQKETRNLFLVFAILAIVFPIFLAGVLFAIAIAGGLNAGIDAINAGDTGPAVQRGFVEAIKSYVGWLFLAVFGGAFLVYLFGRSHKLRRFRHRLGLISPVLRKRALSENLSHLSFHLSRLAKSGLTPFASWRLAAAAVPNEAYAAKALTLAEAMNEKTRLSELLYKSKLFPYEMTQLVETGEITGDLPHALDEVMDFGRSQEKQANTFIAFRVGCWTLLFFTVGGVIIFAIPYLTYLRGVFRIAE
jgi:type II secretory pathway component PulF